MASGAEAGYEGGCVSAGEGSMASVWAIVTVVAVFGVLNLIEYRRVD
jgi:hypothetical protein